MIFYGHGVNWGHGKLRLEAMSLGSNILREPYVTSGASQFLRVHRVGLIPESDNSTCHWLDTMEL